MTDQPELEKCPWCKQEPDMVQNTDRACVYCLWRNCDINPTIHGETARVAVANWNQLARDHQLAENIRELMDREMIVFEPRGGDCAYLVDEQDVRRAIETMRKELIDAAKEIEGGPQS